MNCYLISYDLHKKRNYELIHDGIDKVSKKIWVKVLESSYLIRSDLNSVDIRDFLLKFIDEDDSLFVINVNINDWATKEVSKDLTNVLHHWSKL